MNMMNGKHNPMPTGMGNAVYWRDDQIALTFVSHLGLDASRQDIAMAVDANLHMINTYALNGTPFTLKRLSKNPSSDQNTAQGLASAPSAADDLTGISIYASPTDTPGTMHIIVFCTIDTMKTNDQAAQDRATILKLVRQLNTYQWPESNQVMLKAAPNWFWSGVGGDFDPTHGCPVTPPFPVENGGRNGQWKTHFPTLPDKFENARGAGVTVVILDAFPAPEQIQYAANAAGPQNTLLQHMATGMLSREPFQVVAPAISLNSTYEVPGPEQTAVTGKDIYGRLAGFPMADHGLFIAGLIRDIVPEASIECVRILNDFAVGEVSVLVQALANIEARLRAGDLQGQRVVINMSLVIGPPECDLERLGLTPTELFTLLNPLHMLMQSIAQRGAIFVISVGNDSDPRDFNMNPSEMRFNARYPAAFGNDLTNIDPSFTPLRAIIPVGAVNRRGEPAAYSNYPGLNGLATYGGELPRPEPWLPSAASHTIAHVDTNVPIDALRGVYSAAAYPALSCNDPYPMLTEAPPATQTTYPQYPATEMSAWAYWCGTSFAAPLITGLAARILEGQAAPFDGSAVHEVLVAASQQTTWTGTQTSGDVRGPMIMATQIWVDA